MPGWSLADTHPTQGRTFQRPLSSAEHNFHMDALFSGTADSIQHFELRLLNGSQDQHLISEANVARAWASTKRRYPLAGATIEAPVIVGVTEAKENGKVVDDDKDISTNLHFIVRECDLSVVRPGEIIFGKVDNAEEAQERATTILDGPRALSAELLVQLYVFRETESENARADILHVMGLMAHCVMDGMANRTFIRCFLDTLARGGRPDCEPPQIPLEARLAAIVPPVELDPIHVRSLSKARQRWRQAAAAIIIDKRFARMQGGHTIPCRVTRSTQAIPARSGSIMTFFTPEQSTAIIAKCRELKLTFGNASLVLAQVAMSRVLCRRYLRGEISDEEWEFRTREPHTTFGPMNVRSYLDKAWFDNGGGGEFIAFLGFYVYRLPSMPLGGMDQRCSKDRKHATEQEMDAPPFSQLLPFNRFLYRAGLISKQARECRGTPLFTEITHMMERKIADFCRVIIEQRMSHKSNDAGEDEVLAVKDIPSMIAHGGSSLGNLDPIFPLEYPLPPSHPLSPYCPKAHCLKAGYAVPPPCSPPLADEVDTPPTIAIDYNRTRLHARPGELYLGSATSRGQLSLYVTYDKNVFEEGVVREWLDELRDAVSWYLG